MEHGKDKNHGLVLDQFHDTKLDETLASGTVQDISPKIDLAQTFTVGMNGLLKKVQLNVKDSNRAGNYLFDIRPTRGDGVPLETSDWAKVLFHKIIPWEELTPDESGYISIILAKDKIPVSTGDVLALVLRCNNAASGGFSGNINNQYSGGRAFTRYLEGTSDNSWLGGHGAQPDWDIGFRTYIQPESPPTPKNLKLKG